MFWNIFKCEPKPYWEDFLQTADGHQVYYRAFGNQNGIPVLSFHGGPGGSSRPKYARLFAKKQFNFIQFDQRGCGQSTAADIWRNNNTAATLDDAHAILQKLNIKQPIIVQGVSWGSTLALLFAEKFPELVQKIIVSSVFLARECDYMWVKRDSERFYPDLWAQMRTQAHRRDIFPTYEKLLFSKKETDDLKALTYFGSYEFMLGQLAPQFQMPSELNPKALNAARIAYHYDKNQYFLRENQILAQIGKIKHIPTLIVHNRMDFCCPVKQAWDLHQVLPQSKLIIAPEAGHATPKLFKAVREAIKKFLA